MSANKTIDLKIEDDNWNFYGQALAVSLTNPKAIMFFMAFFPIFLGADPKPRTLIILMVHVSVISFLYQTALVLLGNAIIKIFSAYRFTRIYITRLAGIAIIGFGLRLIFNKRC